VSILSHPFKHDKLKSPQIKFAEQSVFLAITTIIFRFQSILNYLCTGKHVLANGEVIWEEGLIKAEFYQVEGIINELESKPAALPLPVVILAPHSR